MVSEELNQNSLALVSGASGFIGRNLCQRLRERGVRIRALMRHECQGPYVPTFVLRLLAMLGDGMGALRGRRFVFDSDAMEKLVGSACYSSGLIQNDLGFKPERNLQESLEEIAVALRLV